jgi:hypothetical protein
MRFVYGGDDAGLHEAVAFANELNFMDGFWQTVADYPDFTYTDLSSSEIVRRMRAVTRDVAVQHYFRDNSAIAATRSGSPFTIFYNTKFIGRGPALKSNTLVHEFVHNVDWFGDGDRDLEYTHPRRHTSARPRSAPYQIGRIAQDWWDMAHQHEGRQLDDEDKLEGEDKLEDDAFDCDLDDDLTDDEINWVTPQE